MAFNPNENKEDKKKYRKWICLYKNNKDRIKKFKKTYGKLLKTFSETKDHDFKDHNVKKCREKGGYCPICESGYLVCNVCKLSRKNLTTKCPGFDVSEVVSNEIAKGILDYDGKWVQQPSIYNELYDAWAWWRLFRRSPANKCKWWTPEKQIGRSGVK